MPHILITLTDFPFLLLSVYGSGVSMLIHCISLKKTTLYLTFIIPKYSQNRL